MKDQIGIVAVFLLALICMGAAVGPKEQQKTGDKSSLTV
jgi:hypothetical protein